MGKQPKVQLTAAQTALEILESLEREFHIDKTRIYVTGQSMGGFGSWDLIVRRTNLFAAAAPLCGSGVQDFFPNRKTYSKEEFERLRGVPIWVFQGTNDKIVPATGPRKTVATLKEMGIEVKYTEYAGVGHRVWERAYGEPGFM
jgi:predicted peptidase